MSRDLRAVATVPDRTAASASGDGSQFWSGVRTPSTETWQAEQLLTGRKGSPDVPENEDIGRPAGATC